VAELERLGLRVGTVHAFQGSEAHTVVAVLGLVDDDSPARVRFVSDPNLFNVLVTRGPVRCRPGGVDPGGQAVRGRAFPDAQVYAPAPDRVVESHGRPGPP
jgi:hypothetical protein